MEFDPQINIFLLNPDIWYLIGIGLIILDIIVGLDFFVLAFGVGALLTGVTIELAIIPTWLAYWERALLLFSAFSLLALAIIKKLVTKGDKQKDINDY